MEPPDLGDAPLELRHVGESYERLVESVLHDEAALEDMVHQREVLLREVHHRVKNNLQLIASIMNIQMRKAVSPEAKALIKGLHDRVMSLATVHRELYQTSGQADVRADELMQLIVAQVLRMGAQPGREIDVTTDFEPFRLTLTSRCRCRGF
ncbi:MAG: sensor histidine kinase [Rhodobacter sp.]|nr:sensor histidine kinase [Rhodobacter sp.]